MIRRLSSLGISNTHWSFLSHPKAYQNCYARLHSDECQLLREPTRRQFRTASAILSRFRRQHGVMLADDVGLGKTTVAALIAGVFAGRGKRVRVLAPNDAMVRRWRRELEHQLAVMQEAAPQLKRAHLGRALSRLGRIRNLREGDIQVATHGWIAPRHDRWGRSTECDLLIVDEAHRARSKDCLFGAYLDTMRRRGKFGRVLLLTATPFSLSVNEMKRALRLIGADDDTRNAAHRYGILLDRLWSDEFGNAHKFGKEIGEAGVMAVRRLKPWIIRHGVEHLPRERYQYGEWGAWAVAVPQASAATLEMIIRADRALALGKKTGSWTQTRTNDPRFHQGWRHIKEAIKWLAPGDEDEPRGTNVPALNRHRRRVNALLSTSPAHEKISAAIEAISRVVDAGEKVLVFCDHHAVAQELAGAMASFKPRREPSGHLVEADWRKAWRRALGRCHSDKDGYGTFVRWLSCRNIREQVLAWLPRSPRSIGALAWMLQHTRARGHKVDGSISRAAASLFRELSDSRSSRAVISRGASHLPGWRPPCRFVMSTAESPESGGPAVFFENEPDTVMTIFNSPFGPDVLITTDKLSEGVDLHRSCRHIMHYELDPSPIRVVQRRGRIRRIGSWAAKTGLPIMEAYPALEGTRDGALVRIMSARLNLFDLLLGGVGEINVPDDRLAPHYEALEAARERLKDLSLAVVRA